MKDIMNLNKKDTQILFQHSVILFKRYILSTLNIYLLSENILSYI